MSLEDTSEVDSKRKDNYKQLFADVVDSSSQTLRSGKDKKESRTDINRTSESTQRGSKEQVSNGENKSERKVDTQTIVSRDSIERANIAYQLSFSVPIKGRYPINPNCKS